MQNSVSVSEVKLKAMLAIMRGLWVLEGEIRDRKKGSVFYFESIFSFPVFGINFLLF